MHHLRHLLPKIYLSFAPSIPSIIWQFCFRLLMSVWIIRRDSGMMFFSTIVFIHNWFFPLICRKLHDNVILVFLIRIPIIVRLLVKKFYFWYWFKHFYGFNLPFRCFFLTGFRPLLIICSINEPFVLFDLYFFCY